MGIPDEVVVERTTRESYPAEDISILGEQADIDVSEIVGYQIGAYDGFNEIGSIEYYYLPRGNAGYIGWLEVDEDWRRQGIARALRKRAIDHLGERGVNEIWSGPVAPEVQPLAREQGFEKATLPDLSSYYVYRT